MTSLRPFGVIVMLGAALGASCSSMKEPAPHGAATPAASRAAAAATGRQTLNFNPDWRFLRDDAAGAAAPAFDDSKWQLVSTPHTFNDTDTFDNWSTPGHRGEQIQWAGRTWYRKTFQAPTDWRGKKVFVEFEAARQVAEVYLNGQLLGVSKTGFTPFGFDLTPYLQLGARNVLAVMVDNRFMKDPLDPQTAAEIARRNGDAASAAPLSSAANPNLATLHAEINKTIPEKLEDLQADQIPWNNPHWHPAHGGIYRNVRLHVTDPLHIALPLYSFLQTAGVYAYAQDITDAAARVTVEVPVRNERLLPVNDVHIFVDVIDADGRTALSLAGFQPTLAAGAQATVTVSGTLAQPRLWEPAYPHLYRVVCRVNTGPGMRSVDVGRTVDEVEIPLGIRAAAWDVANGFFLNGRHLKLTGWGQKPTNEWPGLGAALPDWLQFYTSRLMHDGGGNFIRWGHAAAGPAQIAAGDRLGLITDQPGVDGEADTVGAAWQLRTQAFRDTLIYFRNSPSILVWEGGNQKVTREHARELRGLMDQFDPHGGRAYTHRRADAITAEFMDVGIGTEGGREIARLPVFEGEYDREEAPRRVWDNASPPNFGYPEAKGMTYQLTSEQFAANEVTHFKKISPPWHAGGANWIFSDSTSGGRVPAEVARASGEVDGARLPKEAYYVTRVLFDQVTPQVHLIGHWSYPTGTKKDVFVASNAEAVELFVNGRSLGRGAVSDKYLFTFKDVAWQPGEIKAVASTGGRVVATQTKRSAGAPAALRITPLVAEGGLRADGADIALFDVEAIDANGERCPTFQQRVDFDVDGPAVWRGGYNSGKVASINNRFLDLEAGLNRVAIRATRAPGRITVRARTEGLPPASATVEAKGFAADNGMTPTAPVLPTVALPATAPAHPNLTAAATATPARAATNAAMLGRFIRTLNYTGPSASIVHVETNAADGRNIYVDRDYTFTGLPPDLIGADWIQVADADQRYSAVDLIELAVKGPATVTIAHDERAPTPDWLAKQFQPSGRTLLINGRPMPLFTRRLERDASLTFGSNTDAAPRAANLYVVFVNAAPAP